MIWIEGSEPGLVSNLDEIVELILPGPPRLGSPEGGQQLRWEGAQRSRLGGKVEDDATPIAAGSQDAAPGVESGLFARSDVSVLPQDMGAGERRVAAQVHFDRGSEPAQGEAAVGPMQERGFGQVQFPGDIPHPRLGSRTRQHADRGGIAGEGAIGEGIDDGDGLHGEEVKGKGERGTAKDEREQRPRGWPPRYGMIASTSISTSIAGLMRRLTSTIVAAGRMSRKNSPCARPTASHWVISVT